MKAKTKKLLNRVGIIAVIVALGVLVFSGNDADAAIDIGSKAVGLFGAALIFVRELFK